MIPLDLQIVFCLRKVCVKKCTPSTTVQQNVPAPQKHDDGRESFEGPFWLDGAKCFGTIKRKPYAE